MAHLRNARLHAIPLFALVCAACFGVADASPPDRGGEQVLDYRAECSEFKPREPILRMRWPVSPKLHDARIYVSIYKDGFRTERFVSVTTADPEAFPKSGVPLRATEAQALQAELPKALALRLDSLRLVKEGAETEAVLSGLIPGVNYYVRVRGIRGETIRVQAPICPVDFVDPPGESPK